MRLHLYYTADKPEVPRIRVKVAARLVYSSTQNHNWIIVHVYTIIGASLSKTHTDEMYMCDRMYVYVCICVCLYQTALCIP